MNDPTFGTLIRQARRKRHLYIEECAKKRAFQTNYYSAIKKCVRMIIAVVCVNAVLITSGMCAGEEPMKTEKAIFAGGCFWCMEAILEEQKGIIDVVSGYTGGEKKAPTYEEVSSGRTGHAEAVEITFNPEEIPYKKLLELFWQNIDPTDAGGQFVDRGTQYKTAIYYFSDEQRRIAEESKKELEQSNKFKNPVVTPILPALAFYPAEEYHQNYYEKCPLQYNLYKDNSGRKQFKKTIWGSEK